MRRDWSTTPIVLVCRPGCPYCQSPNYKRESQEAQGDDGSVMQRVVCLGCGREYRFVTEDLPWGDTYRMSECIDWVCDTEPTDEDARS